MCLHTWRHVVGRGGFASTPLRGARMSWIAGSGSGTLKQRQHGFRPRLPPQWKNGSILCSLAIGPPGLGAAGSSIVASSATSSQQGAKPPPTAVRWVAAPPDQSHPSTSAMCWLSARAGTVWLWYTHVTSSARLFSISLPSSRRLAQAGAQRGMRGGPGRQLADRGSSRSGCSRASVLHTRA